MASRVRTPSGELPPDDGNWDTPDDFFAACARVWGPFDLDVAADASNARAPRYLTKADDGLTTPWHGNVWANPPYLKYELHKWVERAQDYGGPSVMLLPARVDVKWFHDAVYRDRSTFLLIKGRLSFAKMGPARWPSMVMVTGHDHPHGIFSWDWKAVPKNGYVGR